MQHFLIPKQQYQTTKCITIIALFWFKNWLTGTVLELLQFRCGQRTQWSPNKSLKGHLLYS